VAGFGDGTGVDFADASGVAVITAGGVEVVCAFTLIANAQRATRVSITCG
jgi:hypothetical protein